MIKRIGLQGHLEFRLQYQIEDAEDRKTRTGLYRPDSLAITLESRSTATVRPRYTDLKVTSVSLSGAKYKKDGTLGQVRSAEPFYFGTRVPAWVQAVVDEEIRKLQEIEREV